MHTQKRGARLMGRLIAENKRLFIGAGLCTLLSVAIDYMTPLLLAETLDHYLMGLPSTLPDFINRWVERWGGRAFMASHLGWVAAALVALSLVGGAFSFLKGRWQSTAGENVARSLRCTSDVDTVRRFLGNQLLSILNAVLMIVVALAVLFRKHAVLAAWSMLMVPALFLFALLFFRWVVRAFKASDEAEGALSAVLQENLTGVRVVRAFGRPQYEVEKFDEKSRDLRRKNARLNKLLNLYWTASNGMTMLQSGITLVVCVIYAARGEITVGTLVVFTSYIGKLLWPISQLGRLLSDAGKSFVALERMDEILCQPPEPAEPDALRPPLNGDIVFDHVTFGYDGQTVLRDLSFTVPAGKTVAILGPTGSGKSSLVHLLQRLYAPEQGEITIGGVDLQRIDRRYLRSRVGLILQEPFLYSKTLRDNVGITLAETDMPRIERAARDAAALDFIRESEQGWDTLVGERGVTLSGGQKQRVAIARTLLKDSDILIFDDSLSAVDTETDAAIRRSLRERQQGVTTLIISHRIVTLSQADWILVLEDGRVAQQGTHADLIAQPGLYRRIYEIQSGKKDE